MRYAVRLAAISFVALDLWACKRNLGKRTGGERITLLLTLSLDSLAEPGRRDMSRVLSSLSTS